MSFSGARSRRDFLRELAVAGSSLLLSIPELIAQQRLQGSYSTVCTADDDSVRLENGSLSEDAIEKMLSKCMLRLTGKSGTSDAWKELFTPDDTVGIKVNCLAGRELSSSPEIVRAIIAGLNLAGIRNEKIIVWDRSDDDLIRAGYSINTTRRGFLCFGTNGEYDYGLGIVTSSSIGSLLSPILTKMCSAIISVPVMKDHDLAGISGTMKNFYGAIHNPNKYHDSNCSPYVADVMAIPVIRDKVRLTVYDAMSVQFHGGPSYKQKWSWKRNGLLVSTDFVAADSIARKIIDEKRMAEGLKTLKESGREPVYIDVASQKKLGRSNPKEIEVIRV